MITISTHVLDTSKGKPAVEVPILLEFMKSQNEWQEIGKATTNKDGRAPELINKEIPLEKGTYRITFDTNTYFKLSDIKGFYPTVSIVFQIENEEHHHVPLLINPFGYSTYRGS